MRLRICRWPRGPINGVPPPNLQVGSEYEFSPRVAKVLLAQGWAEPIDGEVSPSSAPGNRIPALVLLVDDDADLRQLTATVLSWSGYEVIEAENGQEAIERLAHHTPDLIVLDLNMPVMDGWQFRAEQQRLPNRRVAAIPVLLVSGADGAADHAATLNAIGAIKKPFDYENLLLTIQAALEPTEEQR